MAALIVGIKIMFFLVLWDATKDENEVITLKFCMIY
jgi:hypothetical protein